MGERTDCTARTFVDCKFSQRLLAVWQLRILCRAWLELNAFYFWLADDGDFISAREAAKCAKYMATFVFLAFPDLRDEQMERAA